MLSRVGLGNHVLDGGADWRNLASTIEPSVCGGDAALCRITSTTAITMKFEHEVYLQLI